MTGRGILFVADEFLIPKNRGGRVETANEVLLLAQVLGDDVRLLVPRDPWTTPADEHRHRVELPVPTEFFDRPPRLRAALRRPFLPYVAATRLPSPAELRRLARLWPDARIDVVVAAHDYLWPTAAALAATRADAPVLVRSHNDEARYFAGLARAEGSPALRGFHALEAARSVLLRRTLRRRAERVAVLSPSDARGYRLATTSLVAPLLFEGAVTATTDAASAGGRDGLLFVGALDAPLSVEGLEWFRRAVLPIVAAQHPGARLRVIGRGASPALATALAADPHVEYLGAVDDLDAAFAGARAFVNPVLRGSGVNMKMGGPARRGIPIVTTTTGIRGLAALRPGVAVADEPAAFARACALLLADDAEWTARAAALRAAFDAAYSADAVASAWDTVLERTISRS